MAIPLYLAQTCAEFSACREKPEFLGWMACHFSPYGTGLSNLPEALPAGAMLIVNDRTPICGHDPALITEQLHALTDAFHPKGILLDFQRPDCQQTLTLTQHLAQHLPCPVGVSDLYARSLDCPVFLPPPPLNKPLAEHFAPWHGREIWLEAALDCLCLTVTESGCETSLNAQSTAPYPFSDRGLHCHYRIQQDEQALRFFLRRTKEDLSGLLEEAQALGVTTAVGLYQELG